MRQWSGVVVPTTEQLVDAVRPLDDAGIVDFVEDFGRLPARGEQPPPGYEGDVALFGLIASASTFGFFARSDDGHFFIPEVGHCRDAYFLPAARHPAGLFRLPLFPSQQRAHTSQAFIIQINSLLRATRSFLFSHRKTNPRPALAAERVPRQRGHDGPSEIDVQRAARQRAALAASAAEDSPPREGDADEDGASGSESDEVCNACSLSEPSLAKPPLVYSLPGPAEASWLVESSPSQSYAFYLTYHCSGLKACSEGQHVLGRWGE